jgi:hypothetical protein
MFEQFISHPLAADLAPSHAMLILDIKNMFNAAYCELAHDVLLCHAIFHPLVPLFDLLYADANACWYLMPDSFWDSFRQFEGFAQGCPLSPVFASLVLDIVLCQLNSELATLSTSRHTRRTNTLSYLDDTTCFLSFPDIVFFLQCLSALGTPHGIFLSFHKTHLLTSMMGTSVLPLLAPDDATALTAALNFLTSHGNPLPEITTGIHLLGQPLGQFDFTTSFLTNALSSFSNDIHCLNIGLSDLQTQAVLFRFCTRATVDHLLESDFYAHASLTHPCPSHEWTSSFVHGIDSNTQTFFCRLTSFQTSPSPPGFSPLLPHSTELLNLPASLGGIGIHSPYVTTIASYVIPIARSIQLALAGATSPTSSTTAHLPPSHRAILQQWQSSDSRLFRLFWLYGHDILRKRFSDDPSTHTLTTLTSPTLNLHGFCHDFHCLHYKSRLSSLPNYPSTTADTMSLTSPWMSLALHSISRQHVDHHLDNDTY